MKPQILGALFCALVLGGQGVALGHPAAGPCPARPVMGDNVANSAYPERTATLERELARNPNDAQATLRLARSFLELGNYDEAVTFAERAVNLSPDCSEFHFWLARSYGLKADKTRSFWLARKAREEYQTAVQIDPGNLAARRDLMEFYLQAPWILGGSKDKALAQVEAIASRNATEGDLARAQYWRDLDETGLAAKEYQKILQLKPAQASAYFQVADFFEAEREPGYIEAAVHGASSIAPNDPRLDYYSAVADVMKGASLEKAEKNLKTYLVKTPPRNDFPPHASAHDWLARIYEIQGDKQQAVEQYRSALKLSSDDRLAREGLKRLGAN